MSSFEATAGGAVAEFVPSPIGGIASGFRSERERLAGIVDGAAPPAEDEAKAARDAELDAEYARGVEDGRAVAEASLAGPIEAFTRAVGELDSQRSDYLREQRSLLVELAVSMAERIVARELDTDRAPLAAWIGDAIAAIESDEPIVVQLSTDDHAALDAGGLPALEALMRDPALRLESNAALSPGAARVVAGATSVEAGLPNILERFREGLRDLDSVAATDVAAGEDDAEEPR